MKSRKNVLVVMIAMTMLICMPGFSVNAAVPAAGAITNIANDAATKVFEGFNVKVLDKTTPAVSMRGSYNDITIMCFVSAADKEIGVISRSDYLAIKEKYKKVVKDAGGGTLKVPPNNYVNWHDGFADEFNKFRKTDAGKREEAVVSNTADTIEEYRQEVIKLVNEERAKVGLSAYIVNDKCMEYSQTRAKELAEKYSHTRPDDTNAGYEIIYRGPKTPSDAVKGWMNSPGHKAAILNENRVYVGAGCYINSNGTIYWQMYFERDPEIYANTLILG